MDGTVGAVRDGAAETLGMTMRAIGEKAMLPYIDQLDKIKAEKVLKLFVYDTFHLTGNSFSFFVCTLRISYCYYFNV